MYVCTDRAQVCFNILSKRERKKLSFENPLVEKRKSSTSKKKGPSQRIVSVFNLNVHLHKFVSFLTHLRSYRHSYIIYLISSKKETRLRAAHERKIRVFRKDFSKQL